jgi:2,4-dienoyl-CoA reductase-like NADH-dependent reductase (Old Yellow Enzyme family)
MHAMKRSTSLSLFSPLQIRDVTFCNRVAVSPMAQYSARDGVVQPWHLQHLGSLAVSGAGVVCIESTSVDRSGWGSKTCSALHTDEQEHGLRHLVEQIRTFASTPLGIQLNHSGRKAAGTDPSQGRRALRTDEGAWPLIGPSALAYSEAWPTPVALTTEEVQQVPSWFGDAAARAARAGLQVLELHAAHGYLLHSFLSPISNLREDGYGGTRANRMRLLIEVTEAVRDVWPQEKVLGIRLNAQDWVDGGLTVEDLVEMARAFKARGGDYVTVSAGAIRGDIRIPAAPGYLVPAAHSVREEASIATFVTGLITGPEQADAIIRAGSADMVCLARSFLDDPRWVWHAASVLGHEIEYPMQYQLAHPTVWRPSARS